MKDKIFYDSNPTMDDFFEVWRSFRPRRPSLIINGIDFNEKLDIERIWLHARIGGWNAQLILEFFNITGMWIYPPYGEKIMEHEWKKRGMQVAWPKHPFILSDPQA